MVYGENNKGNLNLLLSFVAKGVPRTLGVYSNIGSFLSIENLSFIIMKFWLKK